MNAALRMTTDTVKTWKEQASELGEQLASEANNKDANHEFVYENYELLREQGFFKIAIPAELGGGGARCVVVAGG